MARLRVIDSSDESDDSLPDIATLARGQTKLPPRGTSKKQQATADNDDDESTEKEPVKAPPTVRRRKLGNISDNSLLRQWTPDLTKAGADDASVAEESKFRTRRPRVAFRSRTSLSAPAALSADQERGHGSNQEDATIIEEVSLAEDMFDTADEDNSAFEDDLGDFIVDDSEEDEPVVEVRENPPKKPSLRLKARNPLQSKAATSAGGKEGNGQNIGGPSRPKSTRGSRDQAANEKTAKKPAVGRDLADTFSGLKL
jgi:hypothetical protein